jgi:hypothetical protein
MITHTGERPPPTRTVALANHDLIKGLFWRQLSA